MANTSAIWQQAAHTTYQLSSPSCSTRTIQISLTLNEKYLSFLEKSQDNGPLAEKWQDGKSKRTRQKQKEKKKERGDRKGESNDSPQIPDRRMTSDINGLPSWSLLWNTHVYYIYIYLQMSAKYFSVKSRMSYLVKHARGYYPACYLYNNVIIILWYLKLITMYPPITRLTCVIKSGQAREEYEHFEIWPKAQILEKNINPSTPTPIPPKSNNNNK